MLIFYIGILLILYSFISNNLGHYKTSVGFFLCFLIMGFQSGVNGDYDNYMNEFIHIDLIDSPVARKQEYFWLYLTYIFQKIVDFPVFICILSLFECACIKSFVDRFANKKQIYISAILFFFTFNYMLIQMKALRQGLAVDLCMLSFVLIAIITIYISKKFFLDRFLIPILSSLDDNHYANYAMDFTEYAGTMGFLPILYNTIIVTLLAWYHKYASNKEQFFIYVSILGFFIDVLVFATGSIQRLLLYFIFANLVVLPGLANQINKQYGRFAYLLFISLLIGYSFKTSIFWLMSGDAVMFGQYQFIFMQ